MYTDTSSSSSCWAPPPLHEEILYQLPPKNDGEWMVVSTRDKLWAGSADSSETKIPYRFVTETVGFRKDGTPIKLPPPGTEVQKQKVRDGMRVWERYANVLFEEVDASNKYCIRIGFVRGKGSYSLVGKDAFHSKHLYWLQTVNLDIDPVKEVNDNERGDILHELGHVLGMLHEHQSPATKLRSSSDIERTLAYYSSPTGGLDDKEWTSKRIEQQILVAYKIQDTSNYSEVDIRSIMHYPLPKEVTGLDQDIPKNNSLSDMDKAFISIVYPRKQPHPDAPEWTLEHALDVAGVKEPSRSSILHMMLKYTHNTVDTVRDLFRWSLHAPRVIELERE